MKLIQIHENRKWTPAGHADCTSQDVVSSVHGARWLEVHTTTVAPTAQA
jgi:hypothetical protein